MIEDNNKTNSLNFFEHNTTSQNNASSERDKLLQLLEKLEKIDVDKLDERELAFILKKALIKEGKSVQEEVVHIIAKYASRIKEPDKSIKFIELFMKDKNNIVRETAAVAYSLLLSNNIIETIKPLRVLINDPNSTVRKAACSAIIENISNLKRDEYKEAVELLIKSKWTRGIKFGIFEIKSNLSEFNDNELLEFLKQIAKNPRTTIIKATIELLHSIMDQRNPMLVLRFMRDLLNNVRGRREIIKSLKSLIKTLIVSSIDKRKLIKIVMRSNLSRIEKQELLDELR